MASTFFGLNIGGSGLNAFQAAINTTANNISNVETEGYSRQSVTLEATSALRVHQKYGSTSTGVTPAKVERMRDEYYDEKYWVNESRYGYYYKKEYYMNQIENYFTDDASSAPGFSTIFSGLFNTLNEVATASGDNSKRNSFVSEAEKFCTFFNSTATEMKELQISINDEIKTTVDQINAIAQKIALLNKQINVIEMEKGQANDLRDSRALLCDELSQIVTCEIEETEVVNSNYKDMPTGATLFTVKLNGQILVDTYDFNTLKTVSREDGYRKNQSDADGLYDLVWANSGNQFNISAKNQVGSLKALFELRDGNDGLNLKGTLDASQAEENKITIKNPSITTIDSMNMASCGTIRLNNTIYYYDGFTANVKTDAEGNSTITSYTFNITDQNQNDNTRLLKDRLKAMDGYNVTVGETVNFKGIPYYQNQMNEFLRSFTSHFNDIEHMGEDLYADPGTSFFMADDPLDSEKQYDFTGTLDEIWACDSDGNPYLNTEGQKYKVKRYNNGLTARNAATGALIATTKTIGFGSQSYSETEHPDNYSNVYYQMTALNVALNNATINDPSRLAMTTKFDNGLDNNDLVDDLEALESKVKLFRGGGADQFLQCIYADITVDAQECRVFADNYKTIETQIQKQRDSISGVDEDGEAMNLVEIQNAYNLASKVISVMAEMYDQLILNTGV